MLSRLKISLPETRDVFSAPEPVLTELIPLIDTFEVNNKAGFDFL
jgi:hypothetical protein